MHKLKNYWRKFFVIQSGLVIFLSMIGLPRNIESLYWWMGITFVDMVATYPAFYEEGGIMEENQNNTTVTTIVVI